jgi:hypothetical protein
MSLAKKQIKIILERSIKGLTLNAYVYNIKQQICGCRLPVIGREKFIENEIILFFESIGFFLNQETGKFSEEKNVSE